MGAIFSLVDTTCIRRYVGFELTDCSKCGKPKPRITYHCDYCEKCVYFTQAHCFKCGICTNKNNYHCDVCNTCINEHQKHCLICHKIMNKDEFNDHSKDYCNEVLPVATPICGDKKIKLL